MLVLIGSSSSYYAFGAFRELETPIFFKRRPHLCKPNDCYGNLILPCGVQHNPPLVKIILYLKWQPLDAGFFKLNIDGAACAIYGKWGIEGVYWNSRGDWVMSYVKELPRTTSMMGNLQVLW